MRNLVIVDYDMGNLASVKNAFRAVGYTAVVSFDPAVIATADALVLPGMGAFGNGMAKLAERELVGPILAHAEAGRPLLGICLGMQLLFEVGEEFGERPGLGLLKGRTNSLPDTVKLPQIGWNLVEPVRPHLLFQEIPAEYYAYFDHTFAAAGVDPSDILATTDYGRVYPSVVGRANVLGIQFHPEKSSRIGLQMLTNFARAALEE
jgi:imidazole glycerol-phosphate synthase subunit HisH